MKRIRVGKRTSHRDVMDQLADLQLEVQALKAEVARLDADLDESRRLNLRAAELLDVVYQELGDRHDRATL
ncbi:DUF6752 domain-containing protein [Arthrobacter sp.]|uniref:DUF6752 domain-containing protein n=1 Tax=Arthrobacter sp. TaxID=1667 RepID=UPI002811CA33|nr:DUF6752 domain-containing protein [Arthrobacter sp.]